MFQNKTTVLVHSEPVEVWTNGHCRAFGAWKCSKEMVGIGWWDGGTVRIQIRWLLGNDSAHWRIWWNASWSLVKWRDVFGWTWSWATSKHQKIALLSKLRSQGPWDSSLRFPKYTLEGQHFAPNLVSFNVLDFLPFYQTIVLSFSWTETEPNRLLLLFRSEHGIYVLSRSQSIFSSAAVSTMSGDHTQPEGLGTHRMYGKTL